MYYWLSHAWPFAAPWTVACLAPQSMEFSRQEYWSGLPFPSPEDLCNPGIEPGVSQITGRFFTIWDTKEAYKKRYFCVIKLISHALGRKTLSWIPPEQAFSLLTFQGCVYTPTPRLLSLPLSVLLQDIFIELSKLDVSDTLKAMAVVAS